jgi:hypothetical protein
LSSTSSGQVISTAAPICPGANQTEYQDSNGGIWLINCGMDTFGGNMNVATNPTYVSSLVACIAVCESTSGCIDVSWVVGTPGPCYLKSSLGAYSQNSGVDNAYQVAKSSSSSSSSSSASSTGT